MAAADTARLIASLEMDNRKFIAASDKAVASLGKIQGRLGAVSGFVNRNLARSLDSVASTGVHALVGAVEGGIDALAQLEDATTSVDGAIKAVGLTGQVTSAQVASWANDIEKNVQAAFDDKDITRNATTLLRYGKVTAKNLHPALVVMTDLAAKTGSVDSAASLLAKALADPAKAAGKLSKAGVVLTKQQQAQIKAFVKTGDLGKAQKVILDSLATSTKNAARDSAGPFRDMQNQLRDTKEDAEKLLAQGFLPVLQKIGGKLQEALANPKTMAAIKDFGQAAADALDKVASFVETIPWDKVGSGLSTAAGFAKGLIDAFTGMPPEVQGTIIALAGLNKLSGGAVTKIAGSIVGDVSGLVGKAIGAGLSKIFAANVTVIGKSVTGPGLPGGGAGGAAGTASGIAPEVAPLGLAAFLGTAAVGGAIGVVATEIEKAITGALTGPIHDITGQSVAQITQAADTSRNQTFLGPIAALTDLPGTVDKMGAAVSNLGKFINSPHPDFLGDLGRLAFLQPPPVNHEKFGPPAPPPVAHDSERERGTQFVDPIVKAQNESRAAFEGGLTAVGTGVRESKSATVAGLDAVKGAAATGLSNVNAAARSGLAGTTGAVNTARSSIVGAIQSNRPNFTATQNVVVNVTASGVERSVTKSTRYGDQNGSAGGGGSHTGTGSGNIPG